MPPGFLRSLRFRAWWWRRQVFSSPPDFRHAPLLRLGGPGLPHPEKPPVQRTPKRRQKPAAQAQVVAGARRWRSRSRRSRTVVGAEFGGLGAEPVWVGAGAGAGVRWTADGSGDFAESARRQTPAARLPPARGKAFPSLLSSSSWQRLSQRQCRRSPTSQVPSPIQVLLPCKALETVNMALRKHHCGSLHKPVPLSRAMGTG